MSDASPLRGWDLPDAVRTGERHGCVPQDVVGCLFFHVKQQYAELGKRLRSMNISIALSCADALVLPQLLKSMDYPPDHTFTTFDRVDLSNVGDFVPAPSLLRAWSPMLNSENRHAALTMHFTNWWMFAPRSTAVKVHEELQGSSEVNNSAMAYFVSANPRRVNLTHSSASVVYFSFLRSRSLCYSNARTCRPSEVAHLL
jgi:hypothetical protein